MKQWCVKSLDELPLVAKEVEEQLKEKVVIFKGEMGAGKTTFISSLLKIMNSEDEVSSPTFSLVNEYHTPKGIVYHFDFYRIEEEEEAYDMGWEEYAYSGEWCFVEWAEKIPNVLPEKYHTLEIQDSGGVRTIKLN